MRLVSRPPTRSPPAALSGLRWSAVERMPLLHAIDECHAVFFTHIKTLSPLSISAVGVCSAGRKVREDEAVVWHRSDSVAPSGWRYRLVVASRRMIVQADFPGAELVEKGLADLADGTETVESLLVSVGAPRLRDLGFSVRAPFEDPEERLYLFLAGEMLRARIRVTTRLCGGSSVSSGRSNPRASRQRADRAPR